MTTEDNESDLDHSFEGFFLQLTSKNENKSLSHFKSVFSLEEHEHFCQRLHEYAVSKIKCLNLDKEPELLDEDEVSAGSDDHLKALAKVCDVIQLYIDLPTVRPSSLLLVIQSLHDILILLEEIRFIDSDGNSISTSHLKNSISRICEHWWNKKEAHAERFILQMIPYLLVSALKTTSHDSDVKRLHKVIISIPL